MHKGHLDNNEEQIKDTLGMNDIISVLRNEFSNIYLVDCKSQQIEIYRYKNQAVGVKEILQTKQPYKAAIQKYIEENVVLEDRKKMNAAADFEHVCSQLHKIPQFTVHYRVKRDVVLSYYYMKCARIGDADTFQRVIFAFANEDADVKQNEIEKIIHADITTGKRKILIIEDDALNREMLCEILKDKYDILTAENGEIGFEILEKNYKALSVILLDMQMPVCDGTEFLKKIGEDTALASIPVIVITANSDEDAELTCLNLGASDFIRKPYNADIIKGRVDNVIKLKESTLMLAAVEHDELTGLYTRQVFLHYAKGIMKFRADTPMHLVVAKIIDFKLIKHMYGNKKADEVIGYLASVYSTRVRNGLVARQSHNSFVGLFWEDYKTFEQKLKNVISEVKANLPVKGLMVKYGVYKDIDKRLPVSAICDCASMAEESIADNYDCDMAYYTEEMGHKRINNQMIEIAFESALKNHEFIVFYQPKVDIDTEKVVGAEALVRWYKDGTSLISPGEFIPVYERDGLIVRLDEYVFRQVCSLQKRRMDKGEELLPISINLSRTSALHEDVAKRYIDIIKENGIPFSCVPIELTESAAIYNDRVKAMTEQLTDAGCILHIDDFGVGYSSLISLNQFPFSTLKIDKSLIDDVCQSKGKTLVEQVITLSKLLDMKVVAEGVETKEQLDIIKALQCDAVQGFYYAKPMPEDEFIEYVKGIQSKNQ